MISFFLYLLFLQNGAAPELRGNLSVLTVCNAQINATDKQMGGAVVGHWLYI